jgi:hypothetical protein
MSEAIRHRDSVVFANIAEVGSQTIRSIASKIGISKDSIIRSLKSLTKRNKHPESMFWNTEAGQQWLRVLVFAVLFEFGLKGHQGADRMSAFFKRIRLEEQVGVSPTSLRTMMNKIEECIENYREVHEKSLDTTTTQEIIAAGDETFFNDAMTLVLMELGSGFIITEQNACNRNYETWKEKAESRLEQLGLKVHHFISDRAKALIKLGLDAFGCKAGADIFHFQHEIGKWLGLGFGRMIQSSNEKLRNAKERLKSLKNCNADPEDIIKAEMEVGKTEADRDAVQQEKDKYTKVQLLISKSVHAFSIDDNSRKTSAQVRGELQQQVNQFQILAAVNEIEDKKGTLDKVRKQIGDLASIVDVWWLWVLESLAGYSLTKEEQDWLLYRLLPVIYWHHQMEKAQNIDMKEAYRKAWEKARADWESHSMTVEMSMDEINQWWSWSEWITTKFQRASSAVEGRNGYLSQLYHNGRGFTESRLKVLTTTHNFDLKRRDGTTAAQRLFNREFPDLFDWIVDNMDALPVARKPRKQKNFNPLNLQLVAA